MVLRDPFAGGRVLHGELLVGNAPDGDAGMVPVAQDLTLEQIQIGRVAAEQAVSSMTNMPRWSQASSSSGVGGLCDVRMALQPNLLQFLDAEILQPSGSAAPTPAMS
jgi:hypothetical protein